jgi:serine/threonine protein kinase
MRGGSADVYLGTYMDMEVAIKSRNREKVDPETKKKRLNVSLSHSVLHSSNLYALQVFRREVLVWKQLNHHRILPVLGVETRLDDEIGIVSPYKESRQTLQEFVKTQQENNDLPVDYRHRNTVVRIFLSQFVGF